MPRYKLTIAYEGTNFCGWQKQFPHADAVPTAPRMTPETLLDSAGVGADEGEPHGPAATGEPNHEQTNPARPRVELRTVQSVLERAVRIVTREPVIIHGASRTDAGVHARGQVAAFTCSDTGGREGGWPETRGGDTLCRAINARLPADVLVTGAQVVDPGFNPITGAVSKSYTYTLWTGHDRPLWERRTALHIWQPLDAEAMDSAAQLLVGEHDFAAFAAAGHGRKTTIRTIFSCRVRRESSERIVMEVSGNGFLWNMVRIIAGTLVEIGKGKMSPSQIDEALRTGERTKAGPTLPPTGLCLEWIRYT